MMFKSILDPKQIYLILTFYYFYNEKKIQILAEYREQKLQNWLTNFVRFPDIFILSINIRKILIKNNKY